MFNGPPCETSAGLYEGAAWAVSGVRRQCEIHSLSIVLVSRSVGPRLETAPTRACPSHGVQVWTTAQLINDSQEYACFTRDTIRENLQYFHADNGPLDYSSPYCNSVVNKPSNSSTALPMNGLNNLFNKRGLTYWINIYGWIINRLFTIIGLIGLTALWMDQTD